MAATRGQGRQFDRREFISVAGVLADYGGSVETITLKADLSNPVLDIGSAISEKTDAIGNAREVDLTGIDNGGTVDAGAVKVSSVPPEAASLIVTTTDHAASITPSATKTQPSAC